ncbi:hypothetical protein NUW58_g5096 [Xylaria curta]|uniref:Uncharacterized protein n=1 Tax=Xylaria curta TaxID=42375 RepID=A0ACC1P5U2_9PEZI|nr:hypothetical protein NUW58_g5096 [Xylaria curta]
MAQEAASTGVGISRAPRPNTPMATRPVPETANVSKPLLSPLVDTQQASDPNTRTTPQHPIQSDASDASPGTPTGLGISEPQDLGNQPIQNGCSIRPSAGNPIPISQSPIQMSVGDIEASPPSIAEPPQTRMVGGRWKTIGAWGGFVIVGGSIGILVVLASLAFLWLGGGRAPEAAGASKLWRDIMLSGRVPQAITLLSLLLRIIVSAQATSCTSLLAALFLERRAVRLSHLPHFSVARGTNDGPRTLLQMIIGSGTRHMVFTVETLLILVLVLATLALQFSSTVLLSDLGSLTVVEDPKPNLLNTSFNDISRVFATVGSVEASQDLATYGEAPSNSIAQPDGRGVSDTGLKQRALLPLNKARAMVRSYHGPAVIGGEGSFGIVCQARGTLDYDASFRNFVQDSTISPCRKSGCEPLPIDCGVPLTNDGFMSGGSICVVETGTVDSWLEGDGQSWRSSDGPWTNGSSIYLVLSSNIGLMDVETTQSLPFKIIDIHDEWASYEIFPTRHVNISMCFVSFNIVGANASMTTSTPLSEPEDNWALSEAAGGSTKSYRRLLGTDLDHQSHEDRGILTLNNPSIVPESDSSGIISIAQPNEYKILELLLYEAFEGAPTPSGDIITSVSACRYCSLIWAGPLGGMFAAVLQDTMNTTQRAALVIDSWMFITIQKAYDNLLLSFDKNQEIYIAFASTVEGPGHCWDTGCRGFFAVLAFTFTHIVCVISIAALYLTKTQYSRLGNIWHTVSQLQCNELIDVLAESSTARDDEVAKLLKDGSRNHLIMIDMSADGSRVEAVRLKDDPSLTKKQSTAKRFFRDLFKRR